MVAERDAPQRRAVAVPDGFDPVPSIGRIRAVEITVVDDVPGEADAVAFPVDAAGTGAEALGADGAGLASVGFEGSAGQTHLIAGDGSVRVAVGIGDDSSLDAAALRDAAAAFALAARRQARLAVRVPRLAGVWSGRGGPGDRRGHPARALPYDPLKASPSGTPVASIALVVDPADREAATGGADAAGVLAAATSLARDLANTPPAHLTAPAHGRRRRRARRASAGSRSRSSTRTSCSSMGCGGILGVNARQRDEPPRMIKLTYTPDGTAATAAARPSARARRQGDHVRLRRHQPEAERRRPRRR